MIRVCAALALLALPGIAAAEEIGTIAATLGGEAKSWHVRDGAGTGTGGAAAEYKDRGTFKTLHLEAHGDGPAAAEMLSLDVLIMGRMLPDSGQVDILYLPGDQQGPFWTSDRAPTPAKITFETFETTEPQGRVKGRFEGEVCFKQSVFTPPDASRCQPVSGVFDSPVAVTPAWSE